MNNTRLGRLILRRLSVHMFSAELSDSLNKLEREKTLNDTVIKVKKNSLDTKLDNATDARAMQDIINQQMKLNNIHINL